MSSATDNGFVERPKESFSRIRFLDYYMEGHKGYIAGGAFKNIFLGEPVKDIDIFFKSSQHYDEAVSTFDEDDRYYFYYQNKNVKCYKNKDTGMKVELISQTFGEPVQVLNKFDFTITKYAYFKKETPEGVEYRSLYIDTFFEDLTNKKLVVDNMLLFPISSFERSYRYKGYGFGLCRESKAKMIEAIRTATVDDLSKDLYFGMD